MKFKKWNVNLDTILDYKVIMDEDEIPDFLNEDGEGTFARAIGFADIAMHGDASEDDIIVWTSDMYLLAAYDVISITNVGDVLNCFSDEEQEKICDWFNETFYEVEFESLKNFFLFIKQAARWENRDEVDEDDFEIMFEDPNDPNRVMGY